MPWTSAALEAAIDHDYRYSMTVAGAHVRRQVTVVFAKRDIPGRIFYE